MIPETIDQAVDALRDGGTIIYPTETCYGIGCDATNTDAIKDIYEIKQRPRGKKLTTVVSDLSKAEEYAELNDLETAVCKEFMPGPLTLIAEKKESVPDVLNDRFAFRISSHPICQALPERLGRPVVATSANVSGNGSNYRVEEIDQSLRGAVDVIIDAGSLEPEPSSTILELSENQPVIHREGPVSSRSISAFINSVVGTNKQLG